MTGKQKILVQQLASAVLFLAVIGLLGGLSVRYKTQLDWTAGHRNTITEASQKQLAAMSDPIKFLVFIYPRSDLRAAIEADLGRYRRFKQDIGVEFVDPSSQPQRVKEYNISAAGEVVVEYQGRRESLHGTNEQAITAALQRLAYAGERWVVFLEGHGERSTADNDRNGYSRFAQVLRDKGLKVRGLNLAHDHRVPDNTAVLVIASPVRAPLEGEVKIVNDYVAGGGNLLWLADPENSPGMGAVAKTLGITWLNGTGILMESAALGLPPFVYVTTQYPPNPVTQDFGENALFPLVRGLSYKAGAGWSVQPLLTTSENAWLETGKLEGQLSLDKSDTPGPLTLGVTLARSAKAGEGAAGLPEPQPQRVAVIGDSDFLANAYLEQLGNSHLGMNLAQWLASRDTQLNIDVPTAPDRSLDISGLGLTAIYLGFAFVLPVLLLGFGITRWVVRRRR